MPNKRDEWGIKLREAWDEGLAEREPDTKTVKINNADSWMTDWYDGGTIIKDVTIKPGLKSRRDL